MGKNISDRAIELTVQGQTVSSNFGTIQAAQFNIEQLIHAGIYSHLFNQKTETFSEAEETLMQTLAEKSFESYSESEKRSGIFRISFRSHASEILRRNQYRLASGKTRRGEIDARFFTRDSVRRRVESDETKRPRLLRCRLGSASDEENGKSRSRQKSLRIKRLFQNPDRQLRNGNAEIVFSAHAIFRTGRNLRQNLAKNLRRIQTLPQIF